MKVSRFCRFRSDELLAIQAVVNMARKNAESQIFFDERDVIHEIISLGALALARKLRDEKKAS